MKPRGQAARLVGVVVQVIDLIDERRQRLLGAHVTLATRRTFRDGENLALGLLDQLTRRFAFFVPHRTRDLAAHGHELAQQRALLDDGGIGTRVGRARRVARERAQVGKAARVVELAEALRGAPKRSPDRKAALPRTAPRCSRKSACGRDGRNPPRPTTSPTLSHAARSSMRPPSTACSASMECGGARRSLGDGSSRRNLGVLDMDSPAGASSVPSRAFRRLEIFAPSAPTNAQKKTAPEGAVQKQQ